MKEIDDEDKLEYQRLAKFDASYSAQALRNFKELFPEPLPPPPLSQLNQNREEEEEQFHEEERRKRKKNLSYPEYESRYKSWVQNAAKRTKKLNPQFLKYGGLPSEKEKKIQLWQNTKKKPKEKKLNMPIVVFNPFSDQGSEDSENEDLSRSRPRKKVHRDDQEGYTFINPYYLECVSQLRENGQIIESKMEQRNRKKQERKECLKLLSSMNFKGEGNSYQAIKIEEKSSLRPSKIQVIPIKEEDTSMTLKRSQAYSNKMTIKEESHDLEPINHPLLMKAEDRDEEAFKQNPPQNSQQRHPEPNPGSLKEEEKETLNYHLSQPQSTSPIASPGKKVDKFLQNTYESKKQSIPDKPMSEGLQRIKKEKDRLKRKMDIVEERLNSCRDNDQIKTLLHKKRKYIKLIDTLIEEEIQERTQTNGSRKGLKNQKQNRETEWERLHREEKEKKEKEQRLLKEHRQAVAAKKEMETLEMREDISSTKHLQDFLDCRDDLRRRAQQSMKKFYCLKRQANNKSHSMLLPFERSPSRQDSARRTSQNKRQADLGRYIVEPTRERTPKKNIRIEERKEEKQDWRKQLKKVTGYDPNSSKFQQRDKGKILESGFDQMQMEQKVSKKLGKKEEEEAKAHELEDYSIKPDLRYSPLY